ncbi:MAG: RDD family protein [Opitutales bacterium]|jgi:uncharacterized RDD family membrane protein YckC
MSTQHAPPGPALIKPGNPLDSVLCDNGPMPPARFVIRALAFCLDLALILGVSALILKVTLFESFPEAASIWADYNVAMQNLDYAKRMIFDMNGTNPELFEIISYALGTTITAAWFYFSTGEAFFGGSSLGKRCCRLRSISTITLGDPTIFSGIVRGGLKTIMLFSFGIIGWAAILIPLLFNKRRQMGHDLLSRTAVIDETQLQRAEPLISSSENPN